MNNLLVTPLSAPDDQGYQLFFGSCGGEQRCTHLRKTAFKSVRRTLVWDYHENNSRVAITNKENFKKLGANFCDGVPKKTIFESIIQACEESPLAHANIAVDVSSLTRPLIANWVAVLNDCVFPKPVIVDFGYSHAKFSKPPASVGLAKRPTAITPDWSGCFTNHELSQLLLIGVGYEPNIALSFCEFLDPATIVAFRPANHDPRYTEAIDRENVVFFDYLDRRQEHVVNYDVFRPYDLYQKIGYMVLSSLDRYRVNIAPYGLKLFVLSALLATASFRPNLLVWHLNPEQRIEKTPNRIASGRVSFLRVQVGHAS